MRHQVQQRVPKNRQVNHHQNSKNDTGSIFLGELCTLILTIPPSMAQLPLSPWVLLGQLRHLRPLQQVLLLLHTGHLRSGRAPCRLHLLRWCDWWQRQRLGALRLRTWVAGVRARAGQQQPRLGAAQQALQIGVWDAARGQELIHLLLHHQRAAGRKAQDTIQVLQLATVVSPHFLALMSCTEE